jgi:hypothetical protein
MMDGLVVYPGGILGTYLCRWGYGDNMQWMDNFLQMLKVEQATDIFLSFAAVLKKNMKMIKIA